MSLVWRCANVNAKRKGKRLNREGEMNRLFRKYAGNPYAILISQEKRLDRGQMKLVELTLGVRIPR